MSEYKDKTPKQITDEDYKVAPTSSDTKKMQPPAYLTSFRLSCSEHIRGPIKHRMEQS